MKSGTLLLAALPLLLLATSALGHEKTMQLLADGKGWSLDKGHLLRTDDNGSHWKDISPIPTAKPDDVFFADSTHGWALLASIHEQRDLNSFKIAITNDSGDSWTVVPVNVPQKPGELDGKGWLDFVDPLHGWVVLQANHSAAFSWAVLLATDDGGRTWRELPQAPLTSRPVFVSPEDGWLSGPDWAGGIYRTHDGGKTWQAANLPLENLSSTLPTRADYGDVKFVDSKNGFLPVWLAPATDAENSRGTALVLFSTNDGGEKWKLDRMLTDQSFAKSGAPLAHFGPISIARAAGDGMMLITTSHEDDSGRLTLKVIAPDGKAAVSTSDNVLHEHEWPVGLSFTTNTQGWLRTSDSRLLKTEDGGATWKEIGPSLPT